MSDNPRQPETPKPGRRRTADEPPEHPVKSLNYAPMRPRRPNDGHHTWRPLVAMFGFGMTYMIWGSLDIAYRAGRNVPATIVWLAPSVIAGCTLGCAYGGPLVRWMFNGRRRRRREDALGRTYER